MGLLHTLNCNNIKNRISIYAYVVVLFIKPEEEDLSCTKVILDCFSEASVLKVNMQKSLAIPIRSNDAELLVISSFLHCNIGSFPCKYLGLPISNRKPKRSDLLIWVVKIADRLPCWKANLPNLAWRTTLVNSVLSAILVYLLITLNVPSWVIKVIGNIRRAFHWKGQKGVNGGSCLVAFDTVTKPRCLGGLGVPNLRFMGWALQLRWLWFHKTDPFKPWCDLEFKA